MMSKMFTSTSNALHMPHNAIREAVVLDSLDPENGICSSCGVHARWFVENGDCVTCADDKLFADSGCRFGVPMNCNEVLHPDCFDE